ncbi:MAG TPA: hypothetical protein ENL12_03280 [Dehalococcoidia bacterium]|nr:hypothetical protein [Dehalococcoidia bacterium]
MLKIDRTLLGRPLRVDEPVEELGISSYDRLRDAITAGDTETALELVDYVQVEGKSLHDVYGDWVYALLTWIADNCGEEKMLDVLTYCKEKVGAAFLDQLKSLKTKKQVVQWYTEQMRAHRSGPNESGTITVREESDRFVISCDPCGAGGRMRRGGQVDDTPPRTEAPFNFGVTRKAYPWSWGRKNVSYYCLHCSIWHELIPMMDSGVPTRLVAEYDPADPAKPCTLLFYKDPQDIPEEFYTRIGLSKPAPGQPAKPL